MFLLREVGDFGIVALKDFGSILSMDNDSRSRLMAALREVYDGSWTRRLGIDGGQSLAWSGKLGIIAGITPAIDSHHAMIALLGPRFLMYRHSAADPDEQARRALASSGRETVMRRALSEATAGALGTVEIDFLQHPIAHELTESLVRIASLAARCRSPIERDARSRDVVLAPHPEAPTRIAKQLLQLLRGLRALGVDENAALRLVSKVGLDSMPVVRRTVLRSLVMGKESTLAQIAEGMAYPGTTVRRVLEELALLEIARHGTGPGRAETWQLTDWATDHAAASLADD